MAAVAQKYSARSAFETDFDLTIYWAVREKQEKRTGKIYVAPGERFWVESGASVWISNGVTLWQYGKTKNQVIVRPLQEVDLSLLPSRLMARYLTAARYRTLLDSADRCVVAAEPDSASRTEDAPQVTLTIDKKRNVVLQIVVADQDSNISTYVFKKTRFGVERPASFFNFTPPPGATVINENE
jgi:outer membrane lipoprotein-sorting protein